MTLTEAEAAARSSFFVFGRDVVGPSVIERDRDASFDRALWKKLGDAGLFKLDTLGARCAALEGLTAGSLDLGLAVSCCAHFVVIHVLSTEQSQKTQQLAGLRDGSLVGACANAEGGSGTDVMGLASRAWEGRGSYVLSARKRSVTNLGVADVALVSARLQGVEARAAVNVFCVDGHGPRVQQRLRSDLAGLRTSPTGSLIAWRADVGDSLVGARGDGVRLFRKMFSEERITTAFLYLGSLKACRDRAVRHAERRSQFGQPIGKNQYVQEKIVRMQIAIDLLEAHLWRVVRDVEGAGGEAANVQGALSVGKAFGVEAALQAAQDLVRLLGARGVSRDEPAERLVRDLLGLSILGGTVELMKMGIYAEAVKALR